MTQKDEALRILKQYNAWRRDKGDTENLVMPDPKEIGEAIDFAIKALSEPELPDGWVAIPVEAGRNQIDAIVKELKICRARILKTAARCVYDTVISSAPKLNEKG